MPPALSDSVVVITGASSGIGLAAARAMASRGARLVLAARDVPALERARADCAARGAEAIAVATDVSEEPAVQALARSAVQRFGRINVWVNNAGVILYGHFEHAPAEAFRPVLETNLFGQVHGTRAALGQFRRQGTGVLINMSSVWGRVTSPYVSAYVTSKFAVRAFSECVRQELVDAPDIHLVTIMPQAVNTPIFRRAANFSGREVKQLPFAREPEDIARRIVACAEDPKREVTDRRFRPHARAGRGDRPAGLEPAGAARVRPAGARQASGAERLRQPNRARALDSTTPPGPPRLGLSPRTT